MAGGKCVYLENVLLNVPLGAASWTPPSILYIALSTLAFDRTVTGSSVVEVSGGGYTRVAVTNNSTNWPNAVSGVKSNGTVFTFPTATAGWGTINSFYILDAASSGNALYGCDLAIARTINTGDTGSFAQNAITATEQ